MRALILILVFMSATFTIKAQSDSLHGPHQGVVKQSGAYKVELVECNDYFEVFLYTKDMDAIHNFGIDGDIKYVYDSGTYKSYPMQYYGNDGFAAKVADGSFIYCRVSMDVLGTGITLKFENQNCSMGTQDK